MITFLKAQTSSLIASLVDFIVTIACVELLGVWYGAASATGNVVGAGVHFTISRKWVFDATQRNVRLQIGKYVCVWAGYVLLNMLMVVLMTTYMSLQYIVAKIIVSIILSVGYNYTLQKRFIFK
jgi:putative flippase GtrA